MVDCFPSLLPTAIVFAAHARTRGPDDDEAPSKVLTQDDLKEQHAHASPVNKLVPAKLRVVKIK